MCAKKNVKTEENWKKNSQFKYNSIKILRLQFLLQHFFRYFLALDFILVLLLIFAVVSIIIIIIVNCKLYIWISYHRHYIRTYISERIYEFMIL